MNPVINCLNCDTSFSGHYCPQCGQKSETKRLTVVSVTKDFLDAISDSDRGFLKTVIDLSQDPRVMLKNYISGKRRRYLSAGKYSFFLIVVFTVCASYLEYHFSWFENMTRGIESFEVVQEKEDKFHYTTKSNAEKIAKENPDAIIGAGEKKDMHFKFDFLNTKVDKKVSKSDMIQYAKYLIPRYHRTLFDYLKVFVVLWIPIFAFFSFLFFYNQGYNFAEHITINAYIYAHILLIYIVFSPLYWLLPQMVTTTAVTSSVAALFYLLYSYFQVFSKGHYRVVKTSLCLMFSLSTYLVTLFALVLVVAFYIFMSHIDKL